MSGPVRREDPRHPDREPERRELRGAGPVALLAALSAGSTLLRGPSGKGSCGGTSPVPAGKQYLPHQGRRERERRLRQAERNAERTWARFEEEVLSRSGGRAVLDRLLDFAAGLQNGAQFCAQVAEDALRAKDPAAEADRLLREAEARPRVNASWFSK